MILAKEEHAEKTYAKLKKRYLTLKAILNVAGVNLTDIDEIKESYKRISVPEPICKKCVKSDAESTDFTHFFNPHQGELYIYMQYILTKSSISLLLGIL